MRPCVEHTVCKKGRPKTVSAVTFSSDCLLHCLSFVDIHHVVDAAALQQINRIDLPVEELVTGQRTGHKFEAPFAVTAPAAFRARRLSNASRSIRSPRAAAGHNFKWSRLLVTFSFGQRNACECIGLQGHDETYKSMFPSSYFRMEYIASSTRMSSKSETASILPTSARPLATVMPWSLGHHHQTPSHPA